MSLINALHTQKASLICRDNRALREEETRARLSALDGKQASREENYAAL